MCILRGGRKGGDTWQFSLLTDRERAFSGFLFVALGDSSFDTGDMDERRKTRVENVSDFFSAETRADMTGEKHQNSKCKKDG